uniref:peptidyl-tRNA hydrolase n=1 Tax=Vespula pensylvanica TaxID=30213 RepID=A0A834NKE4_VESPE|nr:hypothetical protein H0235_013340 [Vespula pensylvanica]
MSALVQYVVIRGDLSKTMGWPMGAIVAQACHACTAVTHLFYNDSNTQAYLADLDSMHKVVLEASDEASLHTLCSKLKEDDIHHKLWIEQPENIPTCLGPSRSLFSRHSIVEASGRGVETFSVSKNAASELNLVQEGKNLLLCSEITRGLDWWGVGRDRGCGVGRDHVSLGEQGESCDEGVGDGGGCSGE